MERNILQQGDSCLMVVVVAVGMVATDICLRTLFIRMVIVQHIAVGMVRICVVRLVKRCSSILTGIG